jgi:CheY-like chemotaxis protein
MPPLQLETRDASERLTPVLRLPSTIANPIDRSLASVDATRSPLVLIVDDHEDSRVIGRVVLESVGFRVAEATTGSEGLRAARRLLPSVVLLDIVLPELDGWDLARLLRAGESTRDMVLIAVTALDAATAVNESLIAGCNETLLKPVPPAALLETLARYVRLPIPSRIRAG